jgi:hypothetical protein
MDKRCIIYRNDQNKNVPYDVKSALASTPTFTVEMPKKQSQLLVFSNIYYININNFNM